MKRLQQMVSCKRGLVVLDVDDSLDSPPRDKMYPNSRCGKIYLLYPNMAFPQPQKCLHVMSERHEFTWQLRFGFADRLQYCGMHLHVIAKQHLLTLCVSTALPTWNTTEKALQETMHLYRGDHGRHRGQNSTLFTSISCDA